MSVDHTKNIIEVKNVSLSYNGAAVLENVSLVVHQGDYLALVGPNGAGKTTLLKIMLGLLPPESGQIKLFGTELKDFRDHFKIGYVPQKAVNFEANFPVTVREVVAMGRYARCGLFRRLQAADQELVKQALEEVGLWEQRDRLIGDLSAGQAQRVFIARALAGQPEVIFLDEPTTGVDQKSQDDFYRLLRELNEHKNLTLVLVSHDLDRMNREVMHIAYLDRRSITIINPASPRI